MLIGEYRHVLDSKKRVSLPAKFRKELGKTVVIAHGLDNCLFVYDLTHWKELASNLSNNPMGQRDSRMFSRLVLGGAVETDVDAAGRILIPDTHKDYAQLDEKVVVMGVYNRVELWSEVRWETYQAEAAKKADELAEKLGEIGMI
ncbi:MAG: division/cell wall cluster transcriptional repressor MraZ [bacterium]|nr:division/cell wall cluster transcriptional repressor MraZ [bacterium]